MYFNNSRAPTSKGRGDVPAETRDGTGVTASDDAYGRLISYTRTGTPSFAMLYSGGTDERVQVSVDGTPRRFVHGGGSANLHSRLSGVSA